MEVYSQPFVCLLSCGLSQSLLWSAVTSWLKSCLWGSTNTVHAQLFVKEAPWHTSLRKLALYFYFCSSFAWAVWKLLKLLFVLVFCGSVICSFQSWAGWDWEANQKQNTWWARNSDGEKHLLGSMCKCMCVPSMVCKDRWNESSPKSGQSLSIAPQWLTEVLFSNSALQCHQIGHEPN